MTIGKLVAPATALLIGIALLIAVDGGLTQSAPVAAQDKDRTRHRRNSADRCWK